MFKQCTTRLDTDEVQALEEIGRSRGGLSVSQVIRLAVAEYIATEPKRIKPVRQELFGQAVGKPLWMGSEQDTR